MVDGRKRAIWGKIINETSVSMMATINTLAPL
jgi:hypothetical protein